MAEPIAVMALKRKRDLISGTIAHYERLIREAEHDLAHINAALRLFEATGEAQDLPPYVDLNRVLRRGETTKICMDALANEGPLDTRQLALRVVRAKGLSESDKVLAQTVALRVVQTLRMRARRGKVESVTRTKGVCVWRLPSDRPVNMTLPIACEVHGRPAPHR
ncbi:MAG: hypothetical protein HYR63_27195 [Proteobacteria bacterium]|nr:hypothetical protein [Pseudomonadota bacterium]MBI3498321.1 hypothetical protein [Pseudomonadota bacterium]